MNAAVALMSNRHIKQFTHRVGCFVFVEEGICTAKSENAQFKNSTEAFQAHRCCLLLKGFLHFFAAVPDI